MLIAKTYDLNGNMLPKKNTSIEKYQILYLSPFHIHISNVPLVHKKFHVHYQMLFQMFYLFLFHLYIYQKVHVHYQMFYLFLFHVFNQRLEPAFCVNLQRCWGKNELVYYLILKIKKPEVRAGGGVKKALAN